MHTGHSMRAIKDGLRNEDTRYIAGAIITLVAVVVGIKYGLCTSPHFHRICHPMTIAVLAISAAGCWPLVWGAGIFLALAWLLSLAIRLL